MGLSIAAPVGPIGLLCVQRTLAGGMLSGFVSGLGAATADAVYGLIAAFGLTAISLALTDHQTAIRMGGGLFLLYLGYTAWCAKPGSQEPSETTQTEGLISVYLSAFALTIANPMTILSFTVIFAGLLGGTNGGLPAAMLVTGVFSGSVLWWLVLAGTVSCFRSRMNHERLILINRISGVIIVCFGVFIVAA